MNLSRIKYLRQELDCENISTEELVEIQEAFAKIPNNRLRESRENATASDMLDELEEKASEVEKTIYNWVYDYFGENEANDPSWNISSLATEINNIPVAIGAEESTIGKILGD